MTRRENTQRRRAPVRQSRPLVLVVCGARCTEPQYFTALRNGVHSRAVDITVTHHAKAPAQVVDYARKFAERSTKDFDEVWCVVDVDDFGTEPTVMAARESGVELAISNPCFELWLLLHHEDRRGALPQCADVHKRLRKHVPGYDKTKLDLACFVDTVANAVERARALDPSASHPERNPSTSVWRLVEKMTE